MRYTFSYSRGTVPLPTHYPSSRAIGFRDSAEEDEVLYIKKISPHLGHVRQLLQAALEQHARSCRSLTLLSSEGKNCHCHSFSNANRLFFFSLAGIPISAPSAAARMPGMQAGGGSGAPSGGFPGGFPPFGGMGMGSGNPADAMRMMSDPNVQAMLNDPEVSPGWANIRCSANL